MIVHFSASLRTLEDDIEIYRRILAAIGAYGSVVAHNWVESAWLYANNKSSDKLDQDWKDFSVRAQTAIENCEVAIIEASGFSSFGAGYEAALAIQRKKPVLLLIKEEKFERSYAAGLSTDNVSIKTYDLNNLEEVVRDFLSENALGTKELRFNFVIDRRIYNHLRRRSVQSGKTKAEVVRDLLLKDIEAA